MSNQPPVLPREVIEAIGRGRKIEAIKLLRNSTRMGLKEAKEAVEAYALAHTAEFQSPVVVRDEGMGAGRWLLLVLVLVLVLGAGLAWLLLGA